MSYYLYNTITQTVTWESPSPYIIDGKPGELPEHIVQLETATEPQPDIAVGKRLESYYEVDIPNKKYITKWSLVDNIPDEIPLWAFRMSLRKNGLKDAVEMLLNALPEPYKSDAWDHYEYGNFIVRTHPLINQLASQLGFTDTQINNIFITGSLLS